MNYHVASLTSNGILSIQQFDTYSEADLMFDAICERYPNAFIDIVSEDDLIECGVAV